MPADGLEHALDSLRIGPPGTAWIVKRLGDAALAGKVVELLGLDVRDQLDVATAVRQIKLVDRQGSRTGQRLEIHAPHSVANRRVDAPSFGP